MRKLKITFVLPIINMAGGVRVIFEHANRLQDRGHTVSVIYPLLSMRNGAKWYDLKSLSIRILKTIRNIIRGNRVKWFDLKARLIRVPTLNERYIPGGDIIVATWWATAFDVNKCGIDKGQKFYFIQHYEIWGGPEDMVNRTYELPLKKIVVSSWLKKILEGKFKISVFGPVMNGINLDQFYRESGNFDCHSPKRVGMIYRKDEWKGMKDGFEAFIKVRDKYGNVKLVLFGEKPLLRDVGVIRKIGNIEFHHLPSRDKLRDTYNSLDIFIFPSRCEGFGYPPMEAMTCGVACISTIVGAVPDYITNGLTGLLCPSHSPNKLAGQLLYLLQNEGKRKEIAKAGYDHIQQFSWDKSVDILEDIFSKE